MSGPSRLAQALAKRFVRELGKRGAKLAVRRIARKALKELAEGLPSQVEKHVLQHAGEVMDKVSHTVFKAGLGKNEILALIKETVKTGGHAVLSELSEGVATTEWALTAAPPSQVGAVQDTEAEASPAVAATAEGARGVRTTDHLRARYSWIVRRSGAVAAPLSTITSGTWPCQNSEPLTCCPSTAVVVPVFRLPETGLPAAPLNQPV